MVGIQAFPISKHKDLWIIFFHKCPKATSGSVSKNGFPLAEFRSLRVAGSPVVLRCHGLTSTIHLFILKQLQRDRSRQREPPLLVHSPDGHGSQDWTGLKPADSFRPLTRMRGLMHLGHPQLSFPCHQLGAGLEVELEDMKQRP